MSIKNWIFDLGNTLMMIPVGLDAVSNLSKIYNYKSKSSIRSLVYKLCNKYHGQSIREFLSRLDKIVNPDRNPVLSYKLREAWMNSVKHAQLKDGALELLDDLHNAGMKLALISNTFPTSHNIIDNLRLRERFDVIIFSCDVGLLKPDPRIFNLALSQLNAITNETVVVGDKIRTDILGGAILGFRSILLEERMKCIVENNQNYVDVIIPRLVDLKNTKFYKKEIPYFSK